MERSRRKGGLATAHVPNCVKRAAEVHLQSEKPDCTFMVEFFYSPARMLESNQFVLREAGQMRSMIGSKKVVSRSN